MVSIDDFGFIHRFEPGPGELTVLALHGTGGDENDLVGLVQMLDPGANVLSPRGKVLEGGMPRFFRRLAMGVFDVDDLKQRARELVGFVDAAADGYGFARDRVIAAGYSNGANVAAGILFLDPGALAGAALFHAMTPFVPDDTPALAEVPVFLSGGRRDPMIPAPETETLERMLTAAGARVTMHWSPGGHELAASEVDAARTWLTNLQ